MVILGFAILLVISILTWTVGKRLASLVMPSSRFRAVIVGLIGGWFANFFGGKLLPISPEVAGINLVAALLGTVLFMLLLGLAPFLGILFRGR